MVFCVTTDADPNRGEHHLYCLDSNVYIFCLLAIKAEKTDTIPSIRKS